MAKVNQGRLDGVFGMKQFTSQALFSIAEEYEAKIADPKNRDDSRWLKRRADRIRLLAKQKEKSLEHKESQKYIR